MARKLRNSRGPIWITIALAIVIVNGCGGGPKKIRVAGAVTFEGRPVEQGEIVFEPINGTSGPQTGGPIKDGQYDVRAESGPMAGGTYQVKIEGFKMTGRMIETGMGKPVPAFDQFLPAHCNSSSVLRVTFPTGTSKHQEDFQLAAEPSA